MPYCLNELVYLTQVPSKDVVILDIKNDKYLVISPNTFFYLQEIVTPKSTKNSLSPQLKKDLIAQLLELGIILKASPQSQDLLKNRTNLIHNSYLNKEELEWRFYEDENKKNLKDKFLNFKAICEALVFLFKAHVLLRKSKIHGLINALEKLHQSCQPKKHPLPEDFIFLARSINKAVTLCPVTTKCVEWSWTLVSMCLRRRLKSNLVLGVNVPPFSAHAWVQSDYYAVTDQPGLVPNHTIIFKTSFE